MFTKKIIIVFLPLLLVSCSEKQENLDMGVVKETQQIVNDYADTLEGSVQDAKAIKNMVETKQQDLQQDIQNAYK